MKARKHPLILRSLRIRRFLFLYLSVILIIASFFGGMLYEKYLGEPSKRIEFYRGAEGEKPDFVKGEVSFDLFWQIWGLAKQDFYKQPVSDEELFYGAIRGIVGSLGDPYSTFMDPEETKEFAEQINGAFEGIGAEIGFRDTFLTIISPLDDSPAERSGLLPGDVVIRIDGEDTVGMSLYEAVRRIKGEKGTTVVLEIIREGEDESREISIVRDEIYIKSLEYAVRDDGIGYIELNSFNPDSYTLFKEAISTFEQNGVKGIILDLRNNTGGIMQAAIDISSYWVKRGDPVLHVRDAKNELMTHTSHGPGALQRLKTVVLINGGSASASEITAGALQDYGFAHLIGTTSFGKGSVQEYINLPGGASTKITIQEWLTPEKRTIHEMGIEPDQEVTLDSETEEDEQLQAAVAYLLE